MRLFTGLALVVLVSLGSVGCTRQQPLAEEVSPVELNSLAQKSIFFGHQSVGWNIIQGMEETLKAQPTVTLTIRQAERIDATQGPAFVHAEIGQNYDPLSKLQAFERLVRAGIGDRAQIAFFKFCYVDFDRNTDVDQLFTAYQQTMADLSQAYPQTTFVYVTAPLMAPEQGAKALLKRLLGRNDEALANLKRHQFNERLRRAYAGNAALFDLAALEATYPDGTLCTVTVANQTVPCLIVEYTDDGGHLNGLGRQVVAAQLLKFLAKLD